MRFVFVISWQVWQFDLITFEPIVVDENQASDLTLGQPPPLLTDMNYRHIVTLGLLTAISTTQLLAAPSMFKERRRMDRLETAETRWQEPERVTLNIHYRVPVVETLGYLAAFYPDAQKLSTITADLRPIAVRVQDLAGDRFEGRSFPAEVDAECRKLRDQMFQDVKDVYGQDTVNRIQNYLNLKYSSMSYGAFSDIVE